MRTGIDARRVAVLAGIAAIAVSLAACGQRAPSLTFTPIPHSTSASAAASGSASAAQSSATPAAPASGSGAVKFPDNRHAMMAFTGTYKAQLIVISATGAVAQNMGAMQDFVWHVTVACGGLCDHAVSSSRATFTLKYAKGEFDGTGGGSSACLDASGVPTGKSSKTSLTITLKPAAAGTPIPGLTGEEFRTVSGDCSSGATSGSEVIQYKLTRTGR